ncbi:MAG: hypothetical protein ACR2FN_12865 [Chitinophagaceae bacterium]
MKHLKLLLLITLPTVFLISCSGNNSSAGTAKNNDDINSSAAAPAGGDAHFSCIVDGQAVSGGAIDSWQQSNTGSIVDVDQGKELLFYLRNIKSGQSSSDYTYSLRFAVPDKTGNMSYGPEEEGWGIEVDIKKGDGSEATYFTDSFTIDVTTLSSTRTAGTFSGKFKIRDGEQNPANKKAIEVTDGKFDIPMAKN